MNFARFFRTPILHMIIYVIQNRSLKNLAKFTAKFIWTAVSGISENGPYLASCKFLMFCRIECKSVFKVLSLFTEIKFSTDLALMNTQPQRIKVDGATQMITEVYPNVPTAVRGNFWTYSVWLTSLKRSIRAWSYLYRVKWNLRSKQSEK